MFEQSALEVRKIVRDFNNDPVGVGGAGETGLRTVNPAIPPGDQERALPDQAHSAAAASMTTPAVESPRSTLDLPTGFPETASEQLGGRSQLVSG